MPETAEQILPAEQSSTTENSTSAEQSSTEEQSTIAKPDLAEEPSKNTDFNLTAEQNPSTEEILPAEQKAPNEPNSSLEQSSKQEMNLTLGQTSLPAQLISTSEQTPTAEPNPKADQSQTVPSQEQNSAGEPFAFPQTNTTTTLAPPAGDQSIENSATTEITETIEAATELPEETDGEVRSLTEEEESEEHDTFTTNISIQDGGISDDGQLEAAAVRSETNTTTETTSTTTTRIVAGHEIRGEVQGHSGA